MGIMNAYGTRHGRKGKTSHESLWGCPIWAALLRDRISTWIDMGSWKAITGLRRGRACMLNIPKEIREININHIRIFFSPWTEWNALLIRRTMVFSDVLLALVSEDLLSLWLKDTVNGIWSQKGIQNKKGWNGQIDHGMKIKIRLSTFHMTNTKGGQKIPYK